MSLNETPSAERIQIAFFGRRNAGKSSLVNALTGQDMAVVSKTRGTTTDPVKKAMELLPLGPVVIIDTPGFDDEGELGEKRIIKAKQVLNRADIAVLVVDGAEGRQKEDEELLAIFGEKRIPYLIVWNKADLTDDVKRGDKELSVSALTGAGIEELKNALAGIQVTGPERTMLPEGIVGPGDLVMLVIPIDESAPKGRLILPQQLLLRELLDREAIPVVVREYQVAEILKKLAVKPKLVVTDSQAFGIVAKQVPKEIALTSFSILMAYKKGLLEGAVRGAAAMDGLKDGDTILIAEGCTHHRQCKDIGTVKLPTWLGDYSGKDIAYETSSGMGFPDDLTKYALILHCGGCMLNGREVLSRMRCAEDQGVAMTNYGIAIAHMHGILRRSVEIFPELNALLLQVKGEAVRELTEF